jgi:hypothetical protein
MQLAHTGLEDDPEVDLCDVECEDVGWFHSAWDV